MTDPGGWIAKFIASTTLCRRLAVELQAVDPGRLERVLAYGSEQSRKVVEGPDASTIPEEARLLRDAGRAELTLVETIRGWVSRY